jgi:hypothetical protein
MNTVLHKFDPKIHTLTIGEIPRDLEAGDVIYLSTAGAVRLRHCEGTWYQRLWLSIEVFMRRILF